MPLDDRVRKPPADRHSSSRQVVSTLSFARTRGERDQSDDPRPSIGERYASRAAYLDVVRSFARALVTARHVFVGLSCAKVGEHERATLSVPPRAPPKWISLARAARDDA